jgi:hypothetical protein
MRFWVVLICLFLSAHAAYSQTEPDTTQDNKAIEKLKYKQQPGLALAASKIFFSDKRYSISGFGEVNFVNYSGQKDITVGDIELYYTNLYRYATFFGYKFTDKIIWNSEFQIEYLHDGLREGHHEIVLEAFVDFLPKEYFKARVGFFPLTIGYVNNNDEPVMFYSVNRSEVERIITPSTWIEFGTMFYGNITENLTYSLALSQGLNANNYVSGTWIRQGREIRFDVPKSVSFNPQLIFTGFKNFTISASGYYGNSGQGSVLNNTNEEVKAPILLGTGYVKYEWENFRFVTLVTYGKLEETDKIHQLTLQNSGRGQVLGSEVYGYLAEVGCDILPYIRKDKTIEEKKNRFYDKSEMKLPLFVRYERLNTHHRIDNALYGLPATQNDLEIVTVGANFNTRENIVFKANYQFRNNRKNPSESDILEFGFGFIF